jgi:hypothetical protein
LYIVRNSNKELAISATFPLADIFGRDNRPTLLELDLFRRTW